MTKTEKNKPAESIDAYIAGYPEDIRLVLEQIRATVRKAAPEAQETIKYGMPTFTLAGNLVHFAVFKHHIGFYPAPTDDPAFEQALSAYKQGKGSIQFPLAWPMPLDLIMRILAWQVKRNMEKQKRYP